MRACALDSHANWEQQLPLVEFAYYNNFQSTIGIAPYEALYGRKCRSLLFWDLEDDKGIVANDNDLLHVEILEDAVDRIQKIK